MNNFNDNPSARRIINSYKDRADLPKNKYNFPLLHNCESIVDGFSSDRSPYDVGSEMEIKQEHE